MLDATFKPRGIISRGTSVVAPVGGLNAYDALSMMPEKDAAIMRNWIPAAYGCAVRRGYVLHAAGFDENVCTVMSWNSINGASKLFAVDSSFIYDITAPGTVTPAQQVVASTNPFWQHTNFTNAAGSHLIAFNGVDNGFWYGPAGYTALTAGDGIVNGTWKNVDPKNLVHTVVHQKRIWAVQKNSSLGWYLPPEQVFGEAKSFDFGANFGHGGYLQALATWTVDSGSGIDDRLAAISNKGDIAVYSGFDPNDPTNWKLDGVFYAGPVFARRCWTKFGGDCAILTQFGIVTLSSLLSRIESVSANNLSLKIQQMLSELVAEGEFRGGWQIFAHSYTDLLFVNIPGVNVSTNFQLVMNTVTKGWTQFQGYRAMCFAEHGAALMFGSFQAVYRGMEGYLDDVDLNGENGKPIRAEAQQAFNYFGNIGQNKHFKMVRANFVYAGEFRFRLQANMSFELGGTPAPAGTGTLRTAIWDEDIWDGDAVWGGGSQNSKLWVFVVGIGYAAAPRLAVETSNALTWVSTDWIMEQGGLV